MTSFKNLLLGAMVATGIAIAPANAAGVPVARGAHSSDAATAAFHKKHKRNHRYANNGERVGPNDRVWRGRDGRYYCKKDNGTTGLLIGGVVGGLAGHEIAGGGDKVLGTVIGAGAGALLGREIDRSNARCR